MKTSLALNIRRRWSLPLILLALTGLPLFADDYEPTSPGYWADWTGSAGSVAVVEQFDEDLTGFPDWSGIAAYNLL